MESCEQEGPHLGAARPPFPSYMESQWCPLPPRRYYAFDEAFVREVLGKKLSKGTKKDLDDISTKTGITLKSCRRQVGPAPPPPPLPNTTSHVQSAPSLRLFGHCPSAFLLPHLWLWQGLPTQSPLASFCNFQTISYTLRELFFQKLRSERSFPLLINFNWLPLHPG